MLDQSFRERAVRKQQGTQLVTAILKNWEQLHNWWAKDSVPESKMAVLTLLAKVLQVKLQVDLKCILSVFYVVSGEGAQRSPMSVMSKQEKTLRKAQVFYRSFIPCLGADHETATACLLQLQAE